MSLGARLLLVAVACLAAASGWSAQARPGPQPTPGADAVPSLGRAPGEPLPAALAAWAEGPPAQLAALINAHNLAAPKSQRILTVFYACGRLEPGRHGAALLWDPAPALDLAERLGGEARVLPWIRGQGRPYGPRDASSLQAAGTALARRIEAERRFAGVLMDGPDGLDPLYAAFRAGTRKTLAAVLDPSWVEAFGQVDAAVVPLFLRRTVEGASQDPVLHRALAADRLEAGLRLCRLKGCRLLAGLPASAAGGAHESAAPGPGGAATPTGRAQADYFEAAVQALGQGLKTGDPAWQGAAVWALRTGPMAFDPVAGFWVGPAEPGPETWARLRLPLVAR